MGRKDPRRNFLWASAILTLFFLSALAPSALARDAYVANFESNTVSVINTQTNQAVGSPIGVAGGPFAIAITPDGKSAYVADTASSHVSVIDTQTNQLIGSPIKVGTDPFAVAITPDGKTVYVANLESESVSVIDTQTNQLVGSPIKVGNGPSSIAVTPNGTRAYVTVAGKSNVSVIDTQTNKLVGLPINVGTQPEGIAITPDGKTAYVTNGQAKSVSVIDTQTNQVIGSPIKVGIEPGGIAITPDGKSAYVANGGSKSVSVIDTQTNQVVASPITVGIEPSKIAITPDGRTAYVTNEGSKNVSVIDTQTNEVIGSPIGVGENPVGIAVVPNQPPLASFSAPRARPGVPVALRASASSDPDGTIAGYAWVFGDGQTGSGPALTHTYAVPGTYFASLTLIDNEGCSNSLIFTGQTAYCSGSAAASQTREVEVAYPGVRLKCPESAKSGGCKFKLLAMTRKPTKSKTGKVKKPKAECALTRAKLKAGHSTIVSLRPKKAFAAKLAVAKNVLVKETVALHGSTRTTYRRLKIVQ